VVLTAVPRHGGDDDCGGGNWVGGGVVLMAEVEPGPDDGSRSQWRRPGRWHGSRG
jgi:hypothetical protein